MVMMKDGLKKNNAKNARIYIILSGNISETGLYFYANGLCYFVLYCVALLRIKSFISPQIGTDSPSVTHSSVKRVKHTRARMEKSGLAVLR